LCQRGRRSLKERGKNSDRERSQSWEKLDSKWRGGVGQPQLVSPLEEKIRWADRKGSKWGEEKFWLKGQCKIEGGLSLNQRLGGMSSKKHRGF